MTKLYPIGNKVEIFFMAFTLLFLETLYFKIARFVLDYLNALLVVSSALTGLGLGALLSHLYVAASEKKIMLLKFVMLSTMILSFLNFVF